MRSQRLQAIFREIIREFETNSRFAERLSNALGEIGKAPQAQRRKRRSPAALDPIRVYEENGETDLRVALGALSLDQLKDVVAEYGMDQTKLVMKWSDSTRVVDQIVKTAMVRANKGNAFR